MRASCAAARLMPRHRRRRSASRGDTSAGGAIGRFPRRRVPFPRHARRSSLQPSFLIAPACEQDRERQKVGYRGFIRSDPLDKILIIGRVARCRKILRRQGFERIREIFVDQAIELDPVRRIGEELLRTISNGQWCPCSCHRSPPLQGFDEELPVQLGTAFEGQLGLFTAPATHHAHPHRLEKQRLVIGLDRETLVVAGSVRIAAV
jgi:hypothetical protein